MTGGQGWVMVGMMERERGGGSESRAKGGSTVRERKEPRGGGQGRAARDPPH